MIDDAIEEEEEYDLVTHVRLQQVSIILLLFSYIQLSFIFLLLCYL